MVGVVVGRMDDDGGGGIDAEPVDEEDVVSFPIVQASGIALLVLLLVFVVVLGNTETCCFGFLDVVVVADGLVL
jgi:hypothetical protein